MDNEKITILIVDDDTGYINLVKYLLDSFNHKLFDVMSESSADSVVDLLRANPQVNLVLMDYYLPDNTGLEITKRISEENINVPIVFLTSNKDYRAAVEAIKYGVADYLLKDTTMDITLPRTLLKVLEHVHLRKQIEEVETQSMISTKKAEAIRELVVTMCHEFNNPLAAIKISAAIMTRQPLTGDEKTLLEKLNANVTMLENQLKTLRDINIDGIEAEPTVSA